MKKNIFQPKNLLPTDTFPFLRSEQENSTFNIAVLTILFLLPILSLSVRHWLSGMFSILALLALATIFRNLRQPLCREEKIILIIFAFFLTSFTISATLNNWTESSYRRIGTEFKYLLFIPLYLLLHRREKILDFLILGIVLGGIVLGLQAIYDTLFTARARGWGIYGPIVFGDLSALFFAFSLLTMVYRRPTGLWRLIVLLSIVLSLLAVYLSGNRNGWLAAITFLFILPILWPKRTLRQILAFYIGGLVIVVIAFGLFHNKISERANIAITQFSDYFTLRKDPEAFRAHNLKGDSVGFRLEQWRIALIVFRDAPWFGHGGGNASRVENEYVKKGLGHPDIYNPKSYTNIGGLHSTYFETLVNEGLIGICILIFFLGYPLYIFIRFRKHESFASSLGIILIIGYMIFGLTENPFVHDNYSSFYLTSLAVLFATMIQRKRQTPLSASN